MTTHAALSTAVPALLRELFHGDAAGSTWIVDDSASTGGTSGLLATIEPLSARQASTAPTGGATLAGHVEHVRWFVALLNAFARGERPPIDWSRSWTVREVDEEGWDRLRADLRREADDLAGHMEEELRSPDLPPERLMPILATTSHCAYHLGAIRQMVASL